MTSAKVEFNGWTIWCEKFGSGPKQLLMIPGTIGTGRTDFYYQLFDETALDLEEFTIVCIELPGWGRSRPPIRVHNENVYEIDSECCVKLMQSLGYDKFSVLGWSEGARIALVLTTLYPNIVENLVLCGIMAFQSDIDTKNIIELTEDVKKWNQRTLDNYLKAYADREEIQKLWSRHMVFIGDFSKYFPNGISYNRFESIICPLLILHGDEDPLIPLEHPLFVLNKVKGAKIKRFSKGSHNFHHKYRSEFKQIVEDFLLGTTNLLAINKQ